MNGFISILELDENESQSFSSPKILPEYRVVMSPDWHDGGIIALAAGDTDTSGVLDDLVTQSWTLFLIDPKTLDAMPLVEDLKDASAAR